MRMHSGNIQIDGNVNKLSQELLVKDNIKVNREIYDRYANASNGDFKEDTKELNRSQKSEMSPVRQRKGSTISPLSPSTNSSQQRRRSVLKKSNKVTIS